MTWTKLAYGTLIAAVLTGGTALWITSRSTVTAEDIARLADRVQAATAISRIAGWPHTNRVSTLAGWSDNYTTSNIAGSTNWSFNFFKYTDGETTIPIFGSALPLAALNQCLDQLTNLTGSGLFVESVTSNTVSGVFDETAWTNEVPAFNMITTTGLWAKLGIGDGTNLWTVGVNKNGNRVYSNHVGSTISTTTLIEAWRVATNLYQTKLNVEFYIYDPYTTNYATGTGILTEPGDAVAPDYSDSPPKTEWNDNGALADLWYWYDPSVSIESNPYVCLEEAFFGYIGEYPGTNQRSDFARFTHVDAHVYVAQFPTNTSCDLRAWLKSEVWDPAAQVGVDRVFKVNATNLVFDGLDTTNDMVVVADQLDFSGITWRDILDDSGIPFMALVGVQSLDHYIDIDVLATWSIGE